MICRSVITRMWNSPKDGTTAKKETTVFFFFLGGGANLSPKTGVVSLWGGLRRFFASSPRGAAGLPGGLHEAHETFLGELIQGAK